MRAQLSSAAGASRPKAGNLHHSGTRREPPAFGAVAVSRARSSASLSLSHRPVDHCLVARVGAPGPIRWNERCSAVALIAQGALRRFPLSQFHHLFSERLGRCAPSQALSGCPVQAVANAFILRFESAASWVSRGGYRRARLFKFSTKPFCQGACRSKTSCLHQCRISACTTRGTQSHGQM
jgi:hypothetical protein